MAMESHKQHGYLLLADISGYTSYLTKVELEHAHAILSELLETITESFKSLLTLCKLEGDAVFAYAPQARISRGETLLELVESTYVSFRDRVNAAYRRTTCTCNACKAIPSLDLKFFIHHGDYMVQHVSGIHELVGSDVNLVHRLMKNHVAKATGWKAYILFTENGLEQLSVLPEGLHTQTERYEHLGEVRIFCLDLQQRYEALVDSRRERVSRAEAHTITTYDYPVSRADLWEWLNDPIKRSLYASEPVRFKAVYLPGGRSGTGARTHCIHGEKLFMVETVLDWRPFDYFTVEQKMGAFLERATYQLSPAPGGGTRLEIFEKGRLTAIAFLDRLITNFMLTRVYPTSRYLESLEKQISVSDKRAITQESHIA
jgi:class 3 adenylate cyclase